MSKKSILDEWHAFAMKTMPVVSTTAGEIYFQLTDDLVWQYGVCCNTGLIVDGSRKYDRDKTLDENIYDIVEKIKDTYN